MRELTVDEVGLVSWSVNWGVVSDAGTQNAIGGAAAGAVGGLVMGMMGTPITAGASVPVCVGLGAVFGAITGWYGGAASELAHQLKTR
jgi:hypothetical protein